MPRAHAGVSPAEIVGLLPSRPVLSSAGLSWEGITLQRFQDPPSTVDFPPLRDHRLGLHLAGQTLLDNACEDHRVRRWSDGGHATLISAGMPVIRSFKGRPDVLQLYIAPALVDEVAAQDCGLDPARACLVEHLVVPDETLDRLGRLLLAEAEAPGERLFADTLIRALVVHLLRRYSSYTSHPPADPPGAAVAGWRLPRVIEHMNANLAEDLSLAQLAAVGGIGPTHFARAFRAAMGELPHRYLVRLRVERARDLLERTTLPVIEVGLRCGFEQPNHFATMFRKITGLSPRAYRKARCT